MWNFLKQWITISFPGIVVIRQKHEGPGGGDATYRPSGVEGIEPVEGVVSPGTRLSY